MRISANFDGGNIEVLDAKNSGNVRLKIRPDKDSEHMQWFYFRVTEARDMELELALTNASEVSYPAGFEGYDAVASYDRDHWFRVPSSYDGKVLTISHTPDMDSVYYAYFAPYSMERHADLVADCQCSPRAQLEGLGSTLDGQDMDLLRVEDPTLQPASGDKKICWIFARQHPGETMAEFLVEGVLERLLDEEDPVARELLRRAIFYVVPNMNPDGSRRGHLRTNAAGANLNREWETPTMARSPEVFLVLNKMRETGVDFALDVHGDEALPYNFIAGSEGVASIDDETRQLQRDYMAALVVASPDFQTAQGYPVDAPGEANLSMATNCIAAAFDCLSMTLEQPFKDTIETPNEEVGWSPDRCAKLGAANLDALLQIIDRL